MKAPKEKVLAELERYKAAEKMVGGLAELRNGKKCFCIEGVFCEVASNLGFDGEYQSYKDSIPGSESKVFVHGRDKAQTALLAPTGVYSFLGIPQYLKPTELNENVREKACVKDHWDWTISWHSLNDGTKLSIAELIDVAIEQLTKKEESSCST